MLSTSAWPNNSRRRTRAGRLLTCISPRRCTHSMAVPSARTIFGSPLRLGVTSLSRRREIPAIRRLRDRSSAITSCTPRERAPSHSVRNLRGLLRPADLAPRRPPRFQFQAPPQRPAKGGTVKGRREGGRPPELSAHQCRPAQRALTTPYGRVPLAGRTIRDYKRRIHAARSRDTHRAGHAKRGPTPPTPAPIDPKRTPIHPQVTRSPEEA